MNMTTTKMKLNELLSFHTPHEEAEQINDTIRRVREYHPEYNVKELSMVCFCGKNVVERCLKANNNLNILD